MSEDTPVGILGVGVYLPSEVRTNDWWPDHIVAQWQERIARRMSSGRRREPSTNGERLVDEALKAMANEPFAGSVERRVLPDDMHASDMEIPAADQALQNAGCVASEIDLLLVSALVPDLVLTNNACTVQMALGIPQTCFATTVDGACNAFSQQLAVADAMIRSGQANRALLVQSCMLSRVLPVEDPHSAWFGDAATAVVVGRVSCGRGLIARADHCDGAVQKAVMAGVPGKRWFDDGPVVVYNGDKDAARAMINGIADTARSTIHDALARADHAVEDVDFFACHQGLSWQRRVTQEYASLTKARTLDTFPMTGNISSATVPLVLSMAQREGLLRDGDLVATFTSGAGLTCSSVVLRWGT